MSVTKVLHIVPSLNIGGVEVGLLRSYDDLNKILTFQVFSIKGAGKLSIDRVSWCQLLMLLFRKDKRPDVVITSLWLGHIVGLLFAVALGSRWVPFFHSARSEGFWRDMILRNMARISRISFFDSPATQEYYRPFTFGQSHIIPFHFKLPIQETKTGATRLKSCIFVGRLSPEKRPDLLIEYLHSLQKILPDSRAIIIASGVEKEQAKFRELANRSGIIVDIRCNVSPLAVTEFLEQSALYLSFSDYEGFGMATIEAISCGCVPVVRPVGEIAAYVDNDCGVLVKNISSEGIHMAAEQSVALLTDLNRFNDFSARARARISHYKFYVDCYVEGVKIAIHHR